MANLITTKQLTSIHEFKINMKIIKINKHNCVDLNLSYSVTPAGLVQNKRCFSLFFMHKNKSKKSFSNYLWKVNKQRIKFIFEKKKIKKKQTERKRRKVENQFRNRIDFI